MKKVLILMGRYLPGHKDGGPLRTIANLTEALGDEYEFFIGCLDRDNGDAEAYPDIRLDVWNKVGKAKVWYVKPGGFTKKKILSLAQDKDLIYLCSFYDDYGYKTLLLKMAGSIQCPVIIAPMGVFSEGALAQKPVKKNIFINMCKAAGLFKNVVWSVTSELEAEDVMRCIGKNISYIVAEDLPRNCVPGWKEKQDVFSVAFLSRISPKKNLIGAIKILQNVRSQVNFVIYGPIEDKVYWNTCQAELQRLPKNIKWSYMGDVQSEEVQNKLAQHDVFLFPTLGENYGHVIFEALSVGCIPLISDQTPWKMIGERKAGYIFSLNNLEKFSCAIDNLYCMDLVDRRKMQERCVRIAKDKIEDNRKRTGYRELFR